MALYIKKNKQDILRNALANLEKKTPIKAVGPGSVVRSFTEAISNEIGDLYDAMDYNLAQSLISTASGRSLDLLGELYNVKRKSVSNVVAVNASIGSFYFYLDTPAPTTITIPAGTKVFTANDSFIGRQLRYSTISDVVIDVGRSRAWAGIKPDFVDGAYTAGADTLILSGFSNPPGIVVKCRNPKPIAAQPTMENDDNFRLRVKKAVRVTASGTLEAVRLAGLGVVGVRDIIVTQAPFGMGSFQVLIVPEERVVSGTVRAEVENALEKVRPIGVRMFLKQPTPIPTDVGVTIMVDPTRVLNNKLTDSCIVAITRYINTLLPGEALVFNKMIQAVFDASDIIGDVQVTSFAPNGVEVLRRNFIPNSDEQIIPGHITVSTT